MVDLYLDWSQDLQITPGGQVRTATGWDQIRQRILRRLITNSAQTLPSGISTPADYVFDPAFGLGMGALVDQDLTRQYIEELKQRIYNAVMVDQDIDSSSPPQVSFSQPTPDTLRIIISVLLANGQSGNLSILV